MVTVATVGCLGSRREAMTMARRIDRWRMYLLCLVADMRDAGVTA